MLFLKTSKNTGDNAETLACEHLKKNRLQILQRNFRTRFGEIDIIAKDQNTLVFIEVKYRASTAFGQPHETVTQKKQHKIIRTAEYYLQKNSNLSQHDCRFDVISINNNQIDWIQNAFDLSHRENSQ